MDCITLDDKKNKMKENEGGADLDKFRRKTLDFAKIEKMLPGLEEYKDPTEQRIVEYLERSNPRAWRNNIWVFLVLCVIFLLTLISLDLKH
jgi:hypothetical protein